jgi:YidC/Oxa1 family membrane protein insertase
MDKRTLIFIFSMTVALLAINTFFSYWDRQAADEWIKQQRAKKEQHREELQQVISANTVPVEELPVVTVDDMEGAFYAYGVEVNGSLILFRHEDKVSEEVRVDGVAYNLTTQPPLTNSPALYEAVPGLLKTKTLPTFGSFDLQLVFLPQVKDKKPRSAFGEYRNAYLTLPVENLAKEFPDRHQEDAPQGMAVAFFKSDGEYLPVGIYDTDQKLLVPLSQFTYLATRLEQIRPDEKYTDTNGEQQFFVLENDYQQLVFSNKGGALSEINLPFRTAENRKSVVKEIGFDRDMVQDYPQNAVFPSRPYYTPGDNEGNIYHEMGSLGGYYPLIRRNLIQQPPFETTIVDPAYYAYNIVSEFPEVANLVYDVKQFDSKTIVFEARQPHRKITKTYTIAQETQDEPYVIDLTIDIEGDSRGLWLTTGIPEVEWINGGIAPALKFRKTSMNGKSQVESITLPDPVVSNSTHLDWITNSNGFLGTITDPLTEIEPGFKAEKVSGLIVPSRLVIIDQEYDLFNPEQMPGYMMMLPLNRKGGTMKFRILAGPFATSVLTTVDQTFSDPATGYNPDYISSQSFHGWFAFISQPFSKFLLMLMNLFHSITNSWGFSIILLTIALRVMLYPLTAWSFKSARKMQEISPKIKKIQEKYKNDPKKLQVEMANVYREAGANPILGCLPMVIQLPFLIGMFDLLKSTFELRGAPFIPGWIDNLAAPDILFTWDYPVFYIGTEFHLLPILMGLCMLAQSKIMNKTKDPSTMSDQERQMQGMGNIMAFGFAIFLYKAPSGLCIYWIFSTVLGILQQKWVNYRYTQKKDLQPQPQVIDAKAQKSRRRKKR